MTKYHSSPRVSPLMKIGEITEWLSVSESAIYKWVDQERFPKPIKFGGADTKRKSSRWVREEVETWFLNHATKREKGMK